MEQPTSSFTAELEAMAVIGQALCGLSDPASRQRVLKWAAERFAAEAAAAPVRGSLPVATAPAEDVSSDPALTIESFDDMFITSKAVEMDDDLGEFAGRAPVAEPEVQRQPLDVMIHSFAQDFKRFVDEWNGAAA
jgi:hypothetical protein